MVSNEKNYQVAIPLIIHDKIIPRYNNPLYTTMWHHNNYKMEWYLLMENGDWAMIGQLGNDWAIWIPGIVKW